MIQKFVASLSDTGRIIFYCAVLAVLVAMFDLLFLRPALNKVTEVEREIQFQNVKIEGDLKILEREDRIVKEYDLYSKFFTKETKKEDDVISGILSSIESLSRRLSMDAKIIYSETIKDENYTQYIVNVDASGDFTKVVKFIYEINSSDDLFKVVEYNLTPKRGTESEVTVSMKVAKMVVYDEPIAMASQE
ncbi:MAG: hypothetical protein KC618_08175 [Candidatus Omnitrophica bacterium]|nr:hypothetical protein [Candidatus Omnitrophota bacterium]